MASNSLEKYIDHITEANQLSARVSESLIFKLGHTFPEKESTDLFLELIIKIKDEDVNVKELTAYLSLLDRLHERLSPKGLKSYSRSRNIQLQIAEFNKGSLELVFKFAYEYREVTALVLIVLFFKYLPNFVKAISESTKNFADSYKSYEEGKLAQTNRAKITETLNNEKSLSSLSDTEREELVVIQESLFVKESKNIQTSKRFAQKYVQKISLRARRASKKTKIKDKD